MDFFKKRGVALAVLVIAIVGAVFIGRSRKDSFIANKPTELLDVAYQNWICDDADLLSDQTEQLIRDYNGSWNGKYYAITAVATIDHLAGWDGQDYAAKLGETWGLGSNDMILLLVKDGDKIAFLGDSITAQGNGNKTSGYVHLVMEGLRAQGLKDISAVPAGVSGTSRSRCSPGWKRM